MAIRPPDLNHRRPANDSLNKAIEQLVELERTKHEAEEQRRIEREVARAHQAAIIENQSRRAVKLRDEGLTYQEIAGRLGIGLSAAYDRVGRGQGVGF